MNFEMSLGTLAGTFLLGMVAGWALLASHGVQQVREHKANLDRLLFEEINRMRRELGLLELPPPDALKVWRGKRRRMYDGRNGNGYQPEKGQGGPIKPPPRNP